MKKITSLLFMLLIALLLVFPLAVLLASRARPTAQYQAQVETQQLEKTAKMHAIQIGFWGGMAILALIGTGGVTIGLIRTVWLRSQLIHPHTHGLFPVIKDRFGRQVYYHDPNRQLAGSVAYRTGPEGIAARHLGPPNAESEQFQIATQAQATQLVAAAGQGRGLTAHSRRLAERVALAVGPRPAPRLPPITVLDQSIAEERHLLTAIQADWESEGNPGGVNVL